MSKSWCGPSRGRELIIFQKIFQFMGSRELWLPLCSLGVFIEHGEGERILSVKRGENGILCHILSLSHRSTDVPWKVLGSGQRNADLGIRGTGTGVNLMAQGRRKITFILK